MIPVSDASMQGVCEVHGIEETAALGRSLGRVLFPGAVVALTGQLGAGKTHLVRAIAEGLAIPDPDVVSSPTFVLIQEYEARLPIYHFDAYRLCGEAEFAELGAHEYFASEGVCLIEWADKVHGLLPPEHLHIAMHVTGAQSRRIEMNAHGRLYEEVVAALGPA